MRRLLGDLAEEEKGGTRISRGSSTDEHLNRDARELKTRLSAAIFVLQYVQPGLAGLMDGSVSTLAPLFAAAFATHHNWQTLVVGLAASIGAGISMAFAERCPTMGPLRGVAPLAARRDLRSDDDRWRDRTLVAYLVPDTWPNAFWIATSIAGVVVFFELWAIAFIRARYMDTPFLRPRSRWSSAA